MDSERPMPASVNRPRSFDSVRDQQTARIELQTLFSKVERHPAFQRIWTEQAVKVLKDRSPDFELDWTGRADERGTLEMRDGELRFLTGDTYQNEMRGKYQALCVFADTYPQEIRQIEPDFAHILYPEAATYADDADVEQERASLARARQRASVSWLRAHLSYPEERLFSAIQQEVALHALRTASDPYFTRHFNGRIDERAYLLDTNNRPSPIRPSDLLTTLHREAGEGVLHQAMRVFLRRNPEVIVRLRKAAERSEVLERPRETRPMPREGEIHDQKEIVDAFWGEGFVIDQDVDWFLREQSVALGNVRYGSGYLQASYKVAELLSKKTASEKESFLASVSGEPVSREMFARVLAKVVQQESRLLVGLLRDIYFPEAHLPLNAVEVPLAAERQRIGACNSSEVHFLDVADPDSDASRNVNVVVDDEGEPLFIEKRQGEPSVMALKDVYLNGTRVPAGAIFGVQWRRGQDGRPRVMDLAAIEGVSLMRLTMFSLPPPERIRAFNLENDAQRRVLGDDRIRGFQRVTMEDFRRVARRQVRLYSSRRE